MHNYAFRCIIMHFNGITMHFNDFSCIFMGKIWQNVFVLNPFFSLLLAIIVRLNFAKIAFVCFCLGFVFFFQKFKHFLHKWNFTFLTSKFLLTYLPSIFWNGANKCPIVSLALSIIFQFRLSWIFPSFSNSIFLGVFHVSMNRILAHI